MAAQITNYQCPACTGPLHFAPESGKMECEYCGSVYELKEIEELFAEKEEKAVEAQAAAEAAEKEAKEEDTGEWDTSDFADDWGNDAEGMKSYICPSCAAELVCDENTAATSCPYCGNPTVVPGKFSGMLKPDYVIPFKLNKDDAVKALKKHYQGKRFLPAEFTSENQIQKIQGVYVPFWMFDGEAKGDADFAATRVRSFRRGDYRITETDHYHVRRSGSLSFEKIPVDASSKMPDEYMDSIEPFDYSTLTAFSTAYLPGFLADKYDVTVDQCRGRADERCKETMENALKNTVTGYTTCMTKHLNVSLKRGKVHYVLLPVWMLTTRWQDKGFLFAINGQNGKTAGNLPISKKKAFSTFAAIAGVLSAVGTAVVMLFL